MIKILEKNNKLQCILSLESDEFKCQPSNIIIDTGCQKTRVTYQDICINGVCNDPIFQKAIDIDMYRKKKLVATRSLGVNDTRSKIKIEDMSDAEILNDSSIGFVHRFNDFSINGLSLGSQDIRVFYKEKSPSLLGMDILKNLYWEYNKGVLLIDFESGKSDKSYSICKKLLKRLIFDKKYSIKESKEVIKQKYPEINVDSIIVDLLEDTYYVDKKNRGL